MFNLLLSIYLINVEQVSNAVSLICLQNYIYLFIHANFYLYILLISLLYGKNDIHLQPKYISNTDSLEIRIKVRRSAFNREWSVSLRLSRSCKLLLVLMAISHCPLFFYDWVGRCRESGAKSEYLPWLYKC